MHIALAEKLEEEDTLIEAEYEYDATVKKKKWLYIANANEKVL